MLDIFIPMLGESYTAGAGGGGGGPTGDAPSATPVVGSVSLYTYASTAWQPGKWGVQWENGDATAATQVDYNGDESVIVSSAPGATWLDLGISVSNNPNILSTIRLRHAKNGQFSAWIDGVAAA